MKLHPPLTLIQREDGLYVEGYDRPKPEIHKFDRYNKKSIEYHFNVAMNLWLSSKKAFKVRNEHVNEFKKLTADLISSDNLRLYSKDLLNKKINKILTDGIDISSLADRIEIVKEPMEHLPLGFKHEFAVLIKPITHCPTCGCECTVEVDAKDRHYYTPKNK